MPTLGSQAGPDTWVDLVAGLSLVTDTSYDIQNVSDTDCLLSEKTTTPVAATPFHRLTPRQIFIIKPNGTDGIWIKADSNASQVHVALTETP